jgi:hypothetical protein
MSVDALPDDTADVVEQVLLDVIDEAVRAHPRSKQKRIGPSEIGTPCDRCLGHKLHGTAEIEQRTLPWATVEGTNHHASMETWFTSAADVDGEYFHEFECEQTVNVGTIDGVDITGSCDLYLPSLGYVIDWKFPSQKAFTKYRRLGPSAVYRAQAHLYARGFDRAGRPAARVGIFFICRGAATLMHHFWTEPYDPTIAENALARAESIAVNIRAMTSISEEAALNYINHLPRDPDCFSCRRYPGAPTKPAAGNTADLLNL